MKQCYYSVLEVDSKATFEEIRQAYKQLSLKWHPDKNRNNIEDATERFQQIAAAYEVLSDPNERAWYDSHRKQILSESNYSEENNQEYDPLEINIWKYFSRDVFLDFNDENSGFYTVYNKLFGDIVEEEMRYLSKNSNEYKFWNETCRFGNSKTDLDKVMEFYRFWSNFSSMRSFSWKDIWNLNQAQNRQIRRAMESENSKERKKGRKEYNETIRKLVEYVKKRDPRVMMHMKIKSEKIAKINIEKEREKKLQDEARRKAREEARVEELRRIEELEAEKRELYGESDVNSNYISDADDEKIIYNCKLCSKFFKSEQQLNSHLKSKKHISRTKEMGKKNIFSNVDGNFEGKNKKSDVNIDVKTDSDKDSENDEIQNYECKDKKYDFYSNCEKESQETQIFSGSQSEDSLEDLDVKKITEMMDNLGGKNQKNRRLKVVESDIGEIEKTNNESKKNKKKKKKSSKETEKKETFNELEASIDPKFLWKCLVCSEKFESRNKLFIHVKELNHAEVRKKSNYNNSKVRY
ncbi:hypothetical protein FG386_000193 [Cryptosporidium ryanae]|uniref:uncharacterized protein n=1 Tax=Cryptosporidium ryanae TaxID=515981 RepID=UPI00351A1947|nr:hypothetical protein FG386_000193 [Cryptosporidium ryanae]